MSFSRSRSSIVAVRVHDAEVAGVEPAAAERLRRRLLVAEVALHDVVAAHDDLAHRLAVARARRASRRRRRARVSGHVRCSALARLQARPLLGGAARPSRVPLADRDRPVGLGQPVDVVDREAERLHARDHAGGGGAPAVGDGHLPARERLARRRGRRASSAPSARRKCVTPSSSSSRQTSAGSTRRRQTCVRARRRHRPREAPAVAVEHGQRPQVARARVEPRVVHLGQRVQVRAAMGVHDALRPAGGAARVVDRDRVVLVVEPRPPSPSGAPAATSSSYVVAGPTTRTTVAERLRARRGARASRSTTSSRRARVLEDVADLRRRSRVLIATSTAPAAGHAVVRLEQLGPFGASNGDAVAALQPRACSARPAAGHALAQLRPSVSRSSPSTTATRSGRRRGPLQERLGANSSGSTGREVERGPRWRTAGLRDSAYRDAICESPRATCSSARTVRPRASR